MRAISIVCMAIDENVKTATSLQKQPTLSISNKDVCIIDITSDQYQFL